MVASSVFGEWIATLQGLGVFQYVLPFVLSFVIIYGILNKIELLGGDGDTGDKLHTVVAAVISLFVIVYTPAGASLGTLFANYFGAMAVVLVGVFGALIVLGLVFGDDWNSVLMDDDDNIKGGVFMLIALLVLAVFLGWGGLGYIFPGLNLDASLPQIGTSNMIGILVVVGTILFLMWALDLTGGSDGDGD